VAEVRLSVAAVEKLERMILTHSLPSDTKDRVRRSLRITEQFPYAGRELDGRWRPIRFILGPWRWLLILYVYDERQDVVQVVTIQDARSSVAATAS
jgi:plasmid stabilization system protein ParE